MAIIVKGTYTIKPSKETPKGLMSVSDIDLIQPLTQVDHDFVQSCLGYLKNEKDLSEFRHLHVVGSEKGPFFGNPNMSVTSWLTALPLTGTDFGWGKDIHMGPALLGSDGKSFFLPTRDGDGSIVVALRLRVDHMDAFKKFFYGDIE